jgi:hypothetical protein
MRRHLLPFVTVLAYACTNGGAVPSDFNFDQQVDDEAENNQVNSSNVKMCVGGANVYVMWIDDRNNFKDVWFNSTSDGGATWSGATRVKQGSGDASGLSLACIGDHVFAAWEDTRDSDSAYPNIYLNFSNDAGRTWEEEDQRIDKDPEGRYISLSPQVAIFQGSVHVVWFDQINGAPEIFVATSSNAGRNFGDPIQVSGDLENPGEYWSGNPRVAIDDKGRTHIAWETTKSGTQEIFYSRLNETGDNFTPPQRVNVGEKPGKFFAFAPAMGVSGDNVYIAWHDTRGGDGLDMFFNYSANGGGDWLEAAVRVESDAAGSHESRDAAVEVIDDVAHIVWEDNVDGGYDIKYRTAKAGVLGDEEIRLDGGDSPGTGNSVHPKIASKGDLMVTAWEDLRAGGDAGFDDLYYNFSSSADPARPWDTNRDYRLSSVLAGTSFTKDLNVATDGELVYSAWLDFRQGDKDGDVYFAAVVPGEAISTAEDAVAAGLTK